MYSREMGGIRSDGQLYAMGHPPEAETYREQPPAGEVCPAPEPEKKKGLLDLSFLHDIKLEDLLLLAIGFLLLTGNGEENNDLLILLVGLLLLL